MSPAVRIGLAIAVLGAVGVAAVWLARPGPHAGGGGTEARRLWISSRQCQECHAEVWDEWHGSHHQISYLNPEVRKLSDEFRVKECQACHLPRPIFETGIGNRTLPRITRPDEGVDCLTCHLAPDGQVLARRARPDVPCAPRADARASAVEACETCHNQHGTTDQWRASEWARKGTTCNDCHMPEVQRRHGGKGREHVFHGAHDAAMLRKAGTFRAEVHDGELRMTLTNTGAGHNFPTEERHRAVDIVYRFVPRDGAPPAEWTRAWRFRQPYRDEPGENTQLPAGASKEVRVAIPPGTARVQARLWYRLTPFSVDGDPGSTLLDEKEIPLP